MKLYLRRRWRYVSRLRRPCGVRKACQKKSVYVIKDLEKKPTINRDTFVMCVTAVATLQLKNSKSKKIWIYHKRPTKETYKRDLQKRPTKESNKLPFLFWRASRGCGGPGMRKTCQKRPTNVTRDLQKRPTKETHKQPVSPFSWACISWLRQPWNEKGMSKETYIRHERPTKETNSQFFFLFWGVCLPRLRRPCCMRKEYQKIPIHIKRALPKWPTDFLFFPFLACLPWPLRYRRVCQKRPTYIKRDCQIDQLTVFFFFVVLYSAVEKVCQGYGT